MTQKKNIMRENKGGVGVEEKPSEGYCPLSSPLAVQTGTTGSPRGLLCLRTCVCVCVCALCKFVGGVFEITNFQVVPN